MKREEEERLRGYGGFWGPDWVDIEIIIAVVEDDAWRYCEG